MPEHDQHPPQEPTIERSADLDLDVERVWELISTAEGWSTWLVDEADVTIAAGRQGAAVDDGHSRTVRIGSVEHGRRVSFSWWDRDDPQSASEVTLEIVELVGSRSRLQVTERLIGNIATEKASATSGSARAAIAQRWEVRLLLLCVAALPALVRA